MNLYNQKTGQVILQDDKVLGTLLNTGLSWEIVQLVIRPEALVEPHRLPMPVSFFVLSGQGILTADGETLHPVKGDLIEVDGQVQRSWRNDGPDALELLVIKHLS